MNPRADLPVHTSYINLKYQSDSENDSGKRQFPSGMFVADTKHYDA